MWLHKVSRFPARFWKSGAKQSRLKLRVNPGMSIYANEVGDAGASKGVVNWLLDKAHAGMDGLPGLPFPTTYNMAFWLYV